MESIFVLIAYFSICAFFGKIIEFVFYLYKGKIRKFKTSGFLYGNISPIYGVVGIIIYLYSLYSENLPIILNLIIYFLVPVGIEYVGAGMMNKIFNLKLWDYSKYKFNIKGKICLWVSLVWFLIVLVFVYFVQPFLLNTLNELPTILIRGWAVVFSIYFIVDISLSSKRHFLDKKSRKI